MHITNIMLGKGLGGIEQAALDYAVGLRDVGQDVTFVTHPDAAMNPLASQAQCSLAHLANRGSWDWLAACRLSALCRRSASDSIITHGNRALSLASKNANRHHPLIHVAHNYHIKHLHKADAILCITDHLRQHILDHHRNITPNMCFTMPNMIARQPPRPQRDWHTPPRIGAIGRLVQKKGFDIWLRALAQLKEQGYAFEAWLAGDGEERDSLELLCARLGLQEHVSFKGWVEDTQHFYQEIDIFCLPSLHEPFGIVVIEAMAASLPVIATRSEGPEEILTGRTCGVLVDQKAPEDLAHAIRHMLEAPEKAMAMGQRAYQHVMEYYERQLLSEKLVGIIKHVVNRKTGSGSK